MSKRCIENRLEELSDEILVALDPEIRLQILLAAHEAGKETWVDCLAETCPRKEYLATDRAVTDRLRLAQLFVQQAVFELETTGLQYERLCMQQRLLSEIAANRSGEPSDELARLTECIEEKRAMFITLYTAYHGYREFSRTVLEVELESWLALHPKGPSVLEAVMGVVTDRQQLEEAEDWFNSFYPDPRITLDESASSRCFLLTTEWETMTATIP